MLVNGKYHLSYCTNIHPGESWGETFDNLRRYIPEIKAKVANSQSFGLGLRLSNTASIELNEENRLHDFKAWLAKNDLYVYTMNGFPYGNFHHQKVKDFVYAPDWTSTDRLEYTLRLFNQLAYLLPDGMSGSISTCPISYKHWYSNDESFLNLSLKKSALNFSKVLVELYKIEKETGKHLHLSIEPEPDGLIENSDEVIHFFREYLIPIACDLIDDELAITGDTAEELVYRYINVCYDVCHFSLAYEDPVKTFRKFKQTGINIGKIQISAALKIIFNEIDDDKTWETLSLFNESTYLHQVTEKVGDKVITYHDLPAILNKPKVFNEIRAHFHVPIFLERFGTLLSTQDQIIKVIEYLRNNEVTDHLEIETYTWEVLPAELKYNLSESIVRELHWMKERLQLIHEENHSN